MAPLDIGICPEVFGLGHPTAVRDLRDDLRFASNRVIDELDVVSYLSVPLTSVDGQPLGTLCGYDVVARAWTNYEIELLQDLGAMAQAGFGILENESRYRRLLELSPQPLVVHSGGKLVFVNEAAAHTLGATTPDELVGRPILPFVHPDYRAVVTERVRQTQEESRELRSIEEKFIRLDGAVIDVEVAANPVEFGGAIASQVIFRDVTERKRAVQSLQFMTDAGRALAGYARLRQHARERGAIGSPVARRLVRGPCSSRTAPMQASRRHMSIRHESLCLAVRAPVVPEGRGGRAGDDSQPLDGATWLASVADEGRELVARLDSSTVIAFALRAHDRVLGTMTFGRMGSGRTHTPADLWLLREFAFLCAQVIDKAQLFHELEQTMRLRDGFMAAATHDLRSPLSAIRGRAELCRRRMANTRTPESEELIDSLQRIERGTQRMARLIDDLLDSANIQMRKPLALQCRSTDLGGVVERVAEEQRAQDTADHKILLSLPTSPIVGYWDGARLERLVANLLSNAVKYSPNATDIDVSLSREEIDRGPWVVLRVSDRGIGIPEADVRSVFAPYFRASNVAGRMAGTGIGLSISRAIAESHGGTITFASREGGGSEFTVRLPMRTNGSSDEDARRCAPDANFMTP